jgi:uncharacterized membrane protein
MEIEALSHIEMNSHKDTRRALRISPHPRISRGGFAMKEFLKTTIVGGILFLVPVALVLAVLNHAVQLAEKIVRPISHDLDLDHSIAGFGIVTVLTILLLVAVSFAAGVVARTRSGTRIKGWIESSFLGGLPQYQIIKSMGEGLAQIDGADDLKPVLISLDGGWRLGYQIEPAANGWVTVFVPQAPTLTSGDVFYLPVDRIKPLNMSMMKARSIVKHIGIGSADALRGVNLAG